MTLATLRSNPIMSTYATTTVPGPIPSQIRVTASSAITHVPTPINTCPAGLTSPTGLSAGESGMIITPSLDAGRMLAFSVVQSLGLDDDDEEEIGRGLGSDHVARIARGGQVVNLDERVDRVRSTGDIIHSVPFNARAHAHANGQSHRPPGHPTSRSRAYALGRVSGPKLGPNPPLAAGLRSMAPGATGLGGVKLGWNVWTSHSGDRAEGESPERSAMGMGIGVPLTGIGMGGYGKAPTTTGVSGGLHGVYGSASDSGSMSGGDGLSASEEDLVAGFEAYMQNLKLSDIPATSSSTIYNSHPALLLGQGPLSRPHVSTYDSSSSYASTSAFESGSWNATGAGNGSGTVGGGRGTGLGNGSYRAESLSYFAAGARARSPSGGESLSSDEKEIKLVWERRQDHQIVLAVQQPVNAAKVSIIAPVLNTALSAKAAPFTFKPREIIKEGAEADSESRETNPSAIPPPMQTRKPRRDEPIRPIGMNRTGSHSRSRSEIVYGNTPITSSVAAFVTASTLGLGAEEGQEVLLDSPVALSAASRAQTPLPFKRPSYAAQQRAPATKSGDSLFHAGKRPGLPSLAEMGAKMRAKGGVYGHGDDSCGSPTRSSAPSSPVKSVHSKRYSVESQESVGSFGSSGDGSGSFASSSDHANGTPTAGSSPPSTPTKSRLPAFLQHRRTESGNSIASSSEGQVSPTRSLTFFRDAIAGMRTPESQLDTVCPILRVIPPTVESDAIPTVPIKARGSKRTSSGPALMQAMLEEGLEDLEMIDPQTTRVPVITCTPATALGAVGASPLAMLEAEVHKQRVAKCIRGGGQPVARAERGQTMISALGRRSRAGPDRTADR